MKQKQSALTAKRHEKKYILSQKQYLQLKDKLKNYVVNDQYGNKTICNLYYDTPDFLLIRRSIEKPTYKEKFRIRSYNVPSKDGKVFLEIKKKYNGVVYKRRFATSLNNAMEFTSKNRMIKTEYKNQVVNEINWFLYNYRNIKPRMIISYDREALFAKNDENLRITFDSNLLYRTDELRLESGVFGTPILDYDMRIMELKTSTAIPLWLCNIMDELKIYPNSFSKYGTAYKDYIKNEKNGTAYKDYIKNKKYEEVIVNV